MEYYGQTTLSPIGAALMLPLSAIVLAMPRRWAVTAFLASVCFISDAQRINIAGADFTPIRMLILIGLIRVIARNEFSQVRWRIIDALFLSYVAVGFVANAVLFGFEPVALIRRAGELYTYTGLYFLFRCWLRDGDDVTALARSLAFLAIPTAAFFAVEWSTRYNLFAIFGGVREITWIRDGRLRCQGAFPHAILAGCFWAGAAPLIASLFWQRSGSRAFAAVGLCGSLFVVAACSSSTPLLALAAVGLAVLLFPLRGHIRLIQGFVLALLVFLHFARSMPVWHLLARVNVVGGSTGWHRYFLIDNSIKHFDEWALVGTRSTSHWGPQMFDITNQYLLEGVRGGFLAMLLFIAVLWCAFRGVGKTIASPALGRPEQVQAWLVGAALFGHCAIFFSVSYFGQVPAILWVTVAATVAVASKRETSPAKAVPARVPSPPRSEKGTRPEAVLS